MGSRPNKFSTRVYFRFCSERNQVLSQAKPEQIWNIVKINEPFNTFLYFDSRQISFEASPMLQILDLISLVFRRLKAVSYESEAIKNLRT